MKFIVPTNFSKIAGEALKAAVDFSSKIGNSSITLIHFVKSDSDKIIEVENAGSLSSVEQETVLKSKNYLSISRDLFKSQSINILCIFYSSDSYLYQQIEQLSANLIIMGTQEVERYENEKLLGNNTKKFMKNLKVPVLCLREKLDSANFDKVVFASTLKDKQIANINTLLPLFESLNIEIEILHISSPQKFVLTEKANNIYENIKKQVGYSKMKFTLYNDIGTVEGIVNYCKLNKVDLLIMPIHGQKYLDYFINGSISEVVLDEIRIPAISIQTV